MNGRSGSHGGAGEERVAEDVEGAGVCLATSSGEGVHRVADRDVDEARLGEESGPACARQASGDSASPQIDVAASLVGHRCPVGDVGELQNAAGTKDSMDLGEFIPAMREMFAAPKNSIYVNDDGNLLSS